MAVVAATPYSILGILLDAIAMSQRDQAKLQAEVLALRRQVQVLERQIKRVKWMPADRMLAVLRDRLPRTACAALRVQPETVLGWHRDLGRRATLSCARPRLLGLVGRDQEHHHGVEDNRCGGPVALLASGLGSDDC